MHPAAAAGESSRMAQLEAQVQMLEMQNQEAEESVQKISQHRQQMNARRAAMERAKMQLEETIRLKEERERLQAEEAQLLADRDGIAKGMEEVESVKNGLAREVDLLEQELDRLVSRNGCRVDQERVQLLERVGFYEQKIFEQKQSTNLLVRDLEQLHLDEMMYRTDRMIKDSGPALK
eukprot:TRINITY_DN14539_c0_g1_i9.p1 TRINITY_DN14539_c0_g1~~TRINITY_DN14539_c0_g1_i9.p1  ORF type:complete len:178 (+),score=58.84 TRINITY_DN14539_c0_g1_i9:227-760(+)